MIDKNNAIMNNFPTCKKPSSCVWGPFE